MSETTRRYNPNQFQAIPKRDVEKAVHDWHVFQEGLQRDRRHRFYWLIFLVLLSVAWVLSLWWMVEGFHH